MSGKAKFIELLKGDLLLGTRNLPMHVVAMQSSLQWWLHELARSSPSKSPGATCQLGYVLN